MEEDRLIATEATRANIEMDLIQKFSQDCELMAITSNMAKVIARMDVDIS